VEQYEFTNGSHIHHITISIGAASYPSSSRELEMVIRLADIALYRAKAAGKNRVSADAKVVA
jgi:diguanylate cyclase (GGDEF)-like protein